MYMLILHRPGCSAFDLALSRVYVWVGVSLAIKGHDKRGRAWTYMGMEIVTGELVTLCTLRLPALGIGTVATRTITHDLDFHRHIEPYTFSNALVPVRATVMWNDTDVPPDATTGHAKIEIVFVRFKHYHVHVSNVMGLWGRYRITSLSHSLSQSTDPRKHVHVASSPLPLRHIVAARGTSISW
jgi:hypothetical protein